MSEHDQRLVDMIAEAEERLHQDDEPETCIDLCNKVLAELDNREDRADVLLLRVEAELDLEDGDQRARRTMDEIAHLDIEDPDLLCEVGEIWLDLDDIEAAEAAFRSAIAGDSDHADAHHGLGLVHEARDEHEAMVAAWLRTHELQANEERPDWQLDEAAFSKLAAECIAELPEDLQSKLANVPVVVEDYPSREFVEEGCDPRAPGLFSGTPLPEKSELDVTPHLDVIHLFQRNLERFSDDPEQLQEQVRITVLHEAAHFFGFDEDAVEDLGLS